MEWPWNPEVSGFEKVFRVSFFLNRLLSCFANAPNNLIRRSKISAIFFITSLISFSRRPRNILSVVSGPRNLPKIKLESPPSRINRARKKPFWEKCYFGNSILHFLKSRIFRPTIYKIFRWDILAVLNVESEVYTFFVRNKLKNLLDKQCSEFKMSLSSCPSFWEARTYSDRIYFWKKTNKRVNFLKLAFLILPLLFSF